MLRQDVHSIPVPSLILRWECSLLLSGSSLGLFSNALDALSGNKYSIFEHKFKYWGGERGCVILAGCGLAVNFLPLSPECQDLLACAIMSNWPYCVCPGIQ